jgi:hypothetical protein
MGETGRKMKGTRTGNANTSSVSIRKARPRNVLSNTYEQEKTQIPTLTLEALRAITRIVRGIKGRAASEPADSVDT